MKFFNYFSIFKRMDSLIRRKATGTPAEFARRLNISESCLFRYLKEMKSVFNAPIVYSKAKCTYIYEAEFSLKIGFIQNLF